MIQPLLTTQKLFATTALEADSILTKFKNQPNTEIKKQQITKRTKKTKEEIIEYYLVEVTLENDTVQNILG